MPAPARITVLSPRDQENPTRGAKFFLCDWYKPGLPQTEPAGENAITGSWFEGMPLLASLARWLNQSPIFTEGVTSCPLVSVMGVINW
jgi:hypothetical protein